MVLDVKFYLVIIIIFFNLFDRTWLCSEYSTSVANLPMIYITKSSPQFRCIFVLVVGIGSVNPILICHPHYK